MSLMVVVENNSLILRIVQIVSYLVSSKSSYMNVELKRNIWQNFMKKERPMIRSIVSTSNSQWLFEVCQGFTKCLSNGRFISV